MASTSRLGECEVCGGNAAKYTCPECEVKTCCLACVNIHKKELACSGVRSRVKYKPLTEFSNLDLRSDYVLLEETARVLETANKGNQNKRFTKSGIVLNSMKEAAKRRDVTLEFLPMSFARRKTNTTYLDWKTGNLFWKVKWVFRHADELEIVDERVLDTTTLDQALSKYLDPDECEESVKEVLRFYHSKSETELLVFLRAENTPGQKYYIVHLYETLREALAGKVIVENPTFIVAFADHKDEFDIVFTDDENEDSDKEVDGRSSYFFNENTDQPMDRDLSDSEQSVNEEK